MLLVVSLQGGGNPRTNNTAAEEWTVRPTERGSWFRDENSDKLTDILTRLRTMPHTVGRTAIRLSEQEAQLSPRDRAMRRISWNLANCHAAVQKLLVWQVVNQVSAVATKSCCRQRLTICAINYSGRASELRDVIDLVDRRRSSLSRCERPPFSS